MHIRTVRNSKGQAYYQLVESFRQNGQVKTVSYTHLTLPTTPYV